MTTSGAAPSGTPAGVVTALFRYPVKSMAAEPLTAIDVGWHGVGGDRRWAYVRPNTERNGFPWLTLRQQARMSGYEPFLVDPDRPDHSAVRVRTPAGQEWDVTDERLAAELGPGVRVLKQDRGVFDSAPLSVLTTSSLAGLAQLCDLDLDVRRFRPNIVVDPQTDLAFPEDRWVGRSLTVGGLRLRIDRLDERCSIINLDPRSGERAPLVLRTLARDRGLALGVYASTVQPGRVAVGDAVVLDG